MRDYLAMRPKRELLHSRPEGPSGRGRKPKSEKREYAGSPLQKRHFRELINLMGERGFKMRPEEYFASLPKGKRAEMIAKINALLSRQSDEAVAYERGVGHSDDGPPDYLGMVSAGSDDALQYGIKGMKWGRRRSEAALAADQARRSENGEPVTPTAKRAADSSSSESSQQRYARLVGIAKGNGAGTLSDDDLKFLNARTDAINKVNKMFQENPSWFKTASSDVLKNVAKQQATALATAVAGKYIGGPLAAQLAGAATSAASSKTSPAKTESTQTSASKTTQQSTPKTVAAPLRKPGMTPEQSLEYFRNQPVIPKKPEDYSPSRNYELFKELREAGILTDDDESPKQ